MILFDVLAIIVLFILVLGVFVLHTAPFIEGASGPVPPTDPSTAKAIGTFHIAPKGYAARFERCETQHSGIIGRI